jgi:hypothetical protein
MTAAAAVQQPVVAVEATDLRAVLAVVRALVMALPDPGDPVRHRRGGSRVVHGWTSRTSTDRAGAPAQKTEAERILANSRHVQEWLRDHVHREATPQATPASITDATNAVRP